MLTTYREKGSDWRVEGATIPDHVIWIDLVDPSEHERQLVESRTKIRLPSREALSEIEVSSRLIVRT